MKDDKELMLNALKTISDMKVDITDLKSTVRDISNIKKLVKAVLAVVED